MQNRKASFVLPIFYIFVLIILWATPSLAAIFRYDGPYKGKVIDAETGDPVQGAVVLGVWSRVYSHVAGSTSIFYDAFETVTDENGEFLIKGQGFVFYNPVTSSIIEPMNILIFKFGYEHLGYCTWVSLKVDYLLRKKINWDGNKAIIPLKKTGKEDINKIEIPYRPVGVPDKRMLLLIDEINILRIKRGLNPYPKGGG